MKMKQRKKSVAIGVAQKVQGQFIKLFHQKIPPEKFNALSEEEKYCFLLLGHIHNEINWLHRMTFITTKVRATSNHLESSGRMMQALLVSRLFIAKLYEFSVVLENQKDLGKFLTRYFCIEDISKGEEKFGKLMYLFTSNSWIQKARNKHFLHYPKLSQVRQTLNDPMIQWEPEVTHGEKGVNTFYSTSDFLANYSWFRLVNDQEPMDGLKAALEATDEICSLCLNLIEQSVGHFIHETLISLESNTEIEVWAPSALSDIELSFFTGMNKRE